MELGTGGEQRLRPEDVRAGRHRPEREADPPCGNHTADLLGQLRLDPGIPAAIRRAMAAEMNDLRIRQRVEQRGVDRPLGAHDPQLPPGRRDRGMIGTRQSTRALQRSACGIELAEQ